MVKEYYTLSIEETGSKTEDKLNELAQEGWKLICSYAKNGNWLIMERMSKERKKFLRIEDLNQIIRIVRRYRTEDEIIREISKLKII
jgi:hypothetical protein